MKRISIILIALVLVFVSANAKKAKTITPEQRGLSAITLDAAQAYVGFLASDELQGRECGYPGGKTAGRYLMSQLQSWGVKPLIDDGYAMPFDIYHAEKLQRGARWQVLEDSVALLKNTVHQKLSCRNILCKIDGEISDEYIIVGAHYDHWGFDPITEGDGIYNGADDNASGVQAVMQLIRAFQATGVKPKRTVIFAFWDAEEKGLHGSVKFAETHPEIMSKVKGYLNYDMIGRNNREEDPAYFVYFFTAAYPKLGEWLKEDIVKYGLNLHPDYRAWDKPVGGSDNATFALQDIPIIWYHTDWHPDYHQVSDETCKINWPKLLDITRASFLAAWHWANE